MEVAASSTCLATLFHPEIFVFFRRHRRARGKYFGNFLALFSHGVTRKFSWNPTMGMARKNSNIHVLTCQTHRHHWERIRYSCEVTMCKTHLWLERDWKEMTITTSVKFWSEKSSKTLFGKCSQIVQTSRAAYEASINICEYIHVRGIRTEEASCIVL